MKEELKIPALGESITEVTIGKLLKKSGDFVKVDEEVVEIETAKVNQLLYASHAGVIEFLVQEGQESKVGATIATISTDKTAQSEQKLIQPVQKPERIDKKEWLQEVVAPKVAAPKAVDIPAAPVQEKVKETATLPTQSIRREKMSQIRKTIAKRLVQVQQETAMLTTFNEVDMSAIIAIREKHKEAFQKKYGTKLGFSSFFVKAAADAMKAFPIVNSFIEGDDLLFRESIDIAVAVSSDKGLVVPVLRDADKLSYADIEKAIDDFADRAKSGALKLDELRGGGFTITNGGIFGSLLSTPIINPPQAAILGMHKIEKRAVVVNDQIVIRPMMYLAMSYDHRILDGKDAVTFLVHIKNHLEDPEKMMIGI